MKISLVVIFFGKNFQNWSRQRIAPFSVSPSSVTRKMVPRNPALIDLSGKSASNVSEPSKKPPKELYNVKKLYLCLLRIRRLTE